MCDDLGNHLVYNVRLLVDAIIGMQTKQSQASLRIQRFSWVAEHIIKKKDGASNLVALGKENFMQMGLLRQAKHSSFPCFQEFMKWNVSEPCFPTLILQLGCVGGRGEGAPTQR